LRVVLWGLVWFLFALSYFQEARSTEELDGFSTVSKIWCKLYAGKEIVFKLDVVLMNQKQFHRALFSILTKTEKVTSVGVM
jgi:hypothetical protein